MQRDLELARELIVAPGELARRMRRDRKLGSNPRPCVCAKLQLDGQASEQATPQLNRVLTDDRVHQIASRSDAMLAIWSHHGGHRGGSAVVEAPRLHAAGFLGSARLS